MILISPCLPWYFAGTWLIDTEILNCLIMDGCDILLDPVPMHCLFLVLNRNATF